MATEKRMAAAVRALGVDYVFDTNFSADLTIMEEGNEFLERMTHADEYSWPMFTSCCPGWVRFVKSQYPDMVKNLSTAKSPQQMFGAVAKSYYAQILDVDPSRIFSVSIMPCVAKKHECAIPVHERCRSRTGCRYFSDNQRIGSCIKSRTDFTGFSWKKKNLTSRWVLVPVPV